MVKGISVVSGSDSDLKVRFRFLETGNSILGGENTGSLHQVTGTLDVSGNVSASAFYGDGAHLTNITATATDPAGSDWEMQYNAPGPMFGASANFTFISASVLRLTGALDVEGNVSGTAFYGDGSNLTNITASSIISGAAGNNYEIQLNYEGDLSASDGLIYSGSELFVTGQTEIAGDVVPPSRFAHNLGSLFKPWYRLFVGHSSIHFMSESGASTVEVGNLSVQSGSVLTYTGSTSFGNVMSDTHVFTGSFFQTGSGATSIFRDSINVGGNLYQGWDQVLTTENVTGTLPGHTISGSLIVSGTVDISGSLTASVAVSASTYYGDGSNLSGVGGTPGDGDKSIQFNSGSVFSGSSTLVYDYVAGNMGIGTTTPASYPNYTTLTLNNGATGGTIEFQSTGFRRGLVYNDANDLYVYAEGGDLKLHSNTGDVNIDSDAATQRVSVNSILEVGAELGPRKCLPRMCWCRASSYISASAFIGDGSQLTNITASEIEAAGNDYEIQYNLNDDLTASAELSFDNTSLRLTGSLFQTGGTPTWPEDYRLGTKIYWPDGNDNTIMRGNLPWDETSTGSIVSTPDRAYFIAVDEVNEKLYYGIPTDGEIWSSSFDGTNSGSIVAGVTDVFQIAAAPYQNKIIYSYAPSDGRIGTASLDGTNSGDIITTSSTDIKFSAGYCPENNKIYYGVGGYFYSSSLDGTNQGQIYDTGLYPPSTFRNPAIGYDEVNQKMYWGVTYGGGGGDIYVFTSSLDNVFGEIIGDPIPGMTITNINGIGIDPYRDRFWFGNASDDLIYSASLDGTNLGPITANLGVPDGLYGVAITREPLAHHVEFISDVYVTGDMSVNGNLDVSGSTRLGNLSSDNHILTGSVILTGSSTPLRISSDTDANVLTINGSAWEVTGTMGWSLPQAYSEVAWTKGATGGRVMAISGTTVAMGTSEPNSQATLNLGNDTSTTNDTTIQWFMDTNARYIEGIDDSDSDRYQFQAGGTTLAGNNENVYSIDTAGYWEWGTAAVVSLGLPYENGLTTSIDARGKTFVLVGNGMRPTGIPPFGTSLTISTIHHVPKEGQQLTLLVDPDITLNAGIYVIAAHNAPALGHMNLSGGVDFEMSPGATLSLISYDGNWYETGRSNPV